MSENNPYSERRKRQRFVASRDGNPCFWVAIDGERSPLIDLSLEGFSIAGEPQPPRCFAFELRLTDIPDRIRGEAQMVNFVPGAAGGQIGCRFVSFQGDGAADLKEWLTAHVIAGASVRITAKEAEAIVQGPSLI